jgi:hypothetical protein
MAGFIIRGGNFAMHVGAGCVKHECVCLDGRGGAKWRGGARQCVGRERGDGEHAGGERGGSGFHRWHGAAARFKYPFGITTDGMNQGKDSMMRRCNNGVIL